MSLDALIEAVEAGSLKKVSGADIFEALGRDLQNRQRFWQSYHGSLDAALALHEALLPGWARDVDATAPECGIRVTLHAPLGHPRHPDNDGTVCGDTECESRAWLLAILRAYKQVQA